MSPSPPPSVIVVVGARTHLGGRVADRLSARGMEVVAPDGTGPLVAAISAGTAGRRVAAVVHAEVDEVLCAPVALVDTTPEEWQERCTGPVASALRTARAAYAVLADAGGTVGFVCPSVGLTGAAGHVALASASESVRLLAKSAARRWGRHGITVNAFAPPLAACLPGSPLDAQTAEVNATAFPDVDPADEIAALVAALASPDGPRLTGATLGTDGGELMLP